MLAVLGAFLGYFSVFDIRNGNAFSYVVCYTNVARNTSLIITSNILSAS